MAKNDKLKENKAQIRSNKVMCKACELAKYTINACIDRNYKIDTAKLQKMLVLMHGKYLSEYGKELFPEKVLIWECGVAIKEVNRAFKSYAFGIEEKQEYFIAILEDEDCVIQSVIEEFGAFDVFEINQDNRLRIIKEKYGDKIGEVIPNDFIKKVFLSNVVGC